VRPDAQSVWDGPSPRLSWMMPVLNRGRRQQGQAQQGQAQQVPQRQARYPPSQVRFWDVSGRRCRGAGLSWKPPPLVVSPLGGSTFPQKDPPHPCPPVELPAKQVASPDPEPADGIGLCCTQIEEPRHRRQDQARHNERRAARFGGHMVVVVQQIAQIAIRILSPAAPEWAG